VARVVALSSDLLLGSRVEAMLSAAGHEVSLHASLSDASLEGAELVVADLDTESPNTLSGLDVPVIGFYSHVDLDTRSEAEAAGLDLVIPRSRMSRELPRLAEQLLKSGSG
jgi:hypothetical protein